MAVIQIYLKFKRLSFLWHKISNKLTLANHTEIEQKNHSSHQNIHNSFFLHFSQKFNKVSEIKAYQACKF